MHRRSIEGEWQRRKEYLHPFIEQPVLSPIPEHRRESIASPHPAVARLEADSPLPDLIIEKQRRYIYEDETEEFYNRLEVKMKRFYRKLFLGEDIDIEGVSDNSVPEDIRDLEEIVADDGAAEDFLEDDVSDDIRAISRSREMGKDDGAVISVPEDDANLTDSLVSIEETGGEYSSEGVGETCKTKFEKSQESREESDARSETSNTTSSEAHEKSIKTVQEKLAEISGKIYSLISSDEHVSENEENTTISLSQTYTQEPDQSEDASSVKSLQSVSESSGAIVVTQTVQAMIHSEVKELKEEEHQLEIMRRQATDSLEASIVRAEYSKDERLDLNIEHSMEESPMNTADSRKRSVPVEYEFNLPTRSPLMEISPVLRLNWKRPASSQLFNFAAKKTKRNNQDIGEKSDEDKENFKNVATETVIETSSKEIQVDISTPMSSVNAESQTDLKAKRDADTEICIKHVDAVMQTDDDSVWVECRNTATQTIQRETNDQETQTRRGFEFYRFFDGVNFFFIF